MVDLKTDWPWMWTLTVTILIVFGGSIFVLGSIVELPGLEILGEETYDAIMGSGAFERMSDEQRQHHDWLIAVLGTTMIGWGTTSALIIWNGLRSWIQEGFPKERSWTWQALTYGFSFWFIVDTSISAWNDVWFNVAFNITIYVLLIIPLVYLTPKYLENKI